MATIFFPQGYNSNHAYLYRNGVEDDRKDYNILGTPIQREGYLRKVGGVYLSLYGDLGFMKCIEKGHPHGSDFIKFLTSITSTSDTVKLKEGIAFNGLDPWLCFAENHMLVMYFGDDKPVRKTKVVRSETLHKRYWARHDKWFAEGKETEYSYWDVKDKSKLFLGGIGIDGDMGMCWGFPEMNLERFNTFRTYLGCLEIEPFKASQEYDFTEEEKIEIYRKEEEEKERKRKEAEELERRKNTAGYCCRCGAEHAELIPFLDEWLCRDCFYDILHSS